MALRTHEFVVSQEGKEKEGSLILSEVSCQRPRQRFCFSFCAFDRLLIFRSLYSRRQFTGSYSYSGFRSCIAVNPWDIRGTAAAINQGLTMSSEESHSRWEDLQGHVMGQNAQTFVIGFLTRCLRAAQEVETSDDDGDGENRVLNVRKVVGRWKHCKTRLVVVDWEDGLVSPFYAVESAAIEVLKVVVRDPRNEVWLLSGFGRKDLERVSREVGGRLGIVAENGCFIKSRNTKGEGEWISMVASLNLTWKGICSEMLNYVSFIACHFSGHSF
ncbi:hypothetical protein L218DRAFT_938819 [Marasmius fiardii PR-910]|nr:hypothetical protein L218DRAFT_938819 [Marasmius fiardii PR-910]